MNSKSNEERRNRPCWGLLRRFGHYYFLGLIAAAQIVFLLMLIGFNFHPYPMLALIPGVLPITFAVIAIRRDLRNGGISETPRAGYWMLMGVLLFAFWSGGYFLADAATTAERARFLAPGLESNIPLWSDFSLIYVLVFPLFLSPFFSLHSERALRRMALSNALTIFFCTAIFFVFPVTFERPELSGPADELGTWILLLVHGVDPAWNCLPSEHCAMALVAALALLQERRWLGVWALMTAWAIAFSTLCLKQHYFLDAVVGFSVALGTTWGIRWQGWQWIWANVQRFWRRFTVAPVQEKKFENDRASVRNPNEGLQDSSEI